MFFCGLYPKLLDRCALYTILLQVCHTSYITQFTPKQEEQCLQQYRKQCHIIIGGSYNNCYISLQWVSSLWQMWSRVTALQKFVWDRCRGFAGEVWNNFLFQRTFHNEVQPGREKYNHSFPGKKGMRWWAGWKGEHLKTSENIDEIWWTFEEKMLENYGFLQICSTSTTWQLACSRGRGGHHSSY